MEEESISPLCTCQYHSLPDHCHSVSKFIDKNDIAPINHIIDKFRDLTHIICLQSNLQSISNKFSEFASLIDHNHPKIIDITESWCSEDM